MNRGYGNGWRGMEGSGNRENGTEGSWDGREWEWMECEWREGEVRERSGKEGQWPMRHKGKGMEVVNACYGG